MGQLIFVTGGVKSGKSTFAVNLAKKSLKKVLFVGTALPVDKGMRIKIAKHRQSRPKDWETVEVKENLLSEVQSYETLASTLVLDCLTLYLAQKVEKSDFSNESFFKELEVFFKWTKTNFALSVAVSNEVGLGVVPATRVGLVFSETLGQANQLVASIADRVYFMVSGVPLRVK